MRIERKLRRLGFTLVELLMVIAIISVLSGMFTLAYRGALQESNNQKTLSTVTKISEVLNSRMDEYASYPIVLRQPGLGMSLPTDAFPIPTNNPQDSKALLLERARLLSLREIIAMEMPDHPHDIKWTDDFVTNANSATFMDSRPRTIPTGLGVGGSATPLFVRNRVTARVMHLARKLSQPVSGVFLPIPNWQDTNANAELLFLIVEDSQLNGSSAIELFGASEIGDQDKDGLNEFIDAFGNPIGWLRWPVGFDGIARYHPDMLDPGIITGSGATLRVSIESDPLDRMAADPGYKTASSKPGPGAFPLVVSAGPDGVFGIRLELNPNASGSKSCVDNTWNLVPNYLNGYIFTDPWTRDSSVQLGGTLDDRAAGDNITNYSGNGASL